MTTLVITVSGDEIQVAYCILNEQDILISMTLETKISVNDLIMKVNQFFVALMIAGHFYHK